MEAKKFFTILIAMLFGLSFTVRADDLPLNKEEPAPGGVPTDKPYSPSRLNVSADLEDGVLTVSATVPVYAEISIVNVESGETVLCTGAMLSPQATIMLNALPAGSYSLKIMLDSTTYCGTFII